MMDGCFAFVILQFDFSSVVDQKAHDFCPSNTGCQHQRCQTIFLFCIDVGTVDEHLL